MLEIETDLIMLQSMTDTLRVLSMSEEIEGTTTGSALFGITETIDDYLKKIESKIEEGYKNGNF